MKNGKQGLRKRVSNLSSSSAKKKDKLKKAKTPAFKRVKGECTIPGAFPHDELDAFVVNKELSQSQQIRSYVEWQAPKEKVKHLEKVATENVFGQPMDAWDVRTEEERYWVITSPINLYLQRLFPSLDFTISFHVGVTTRMAQSEMTKEHVAAHDRINELGNRLARTQVALFEAKKPEEFQAVGMKCREVLVLMVKSMSRPEMVDEGQVAPQAANVVQWLELIAQKVAAGGSNERLRSYLKDISKSTWQLVNSLTHAQNADHRSAVIAFGATESVVEAFTFAIADYEKSLSDGVKAKARRTSKNHKG